MFAKTSCVKFAIITFYFVTPSSDCIKHVLTQVLNLARNIAVHCPLGQWTQKLLKKRRRQFNLMQHAASTCNATINVALQGEENVCPYYRAFRVIYTGENRQPFTSRLIMQPLLYAPVTRLRRVVDLHINKHNL